MAEEKQTHAERVAVLEHRATEVDKALTDLNKWMKEISHNLTELVRLQSNLSAVNKDIDRLSARLDNEIEARRDQAREDHAAHDASIAAVSGNVVSIGWIKALVMLAIAAGAGGVVNQLLEKVL